MQSPSQEPPASSKAPKQDLKDRDAFCTFKIMKEGQNSEYKCILDKLPYANQDKTVKPQPGTTSPQQTPKSGLKGHGCSLHLQNQDREPKIGS